MSVRLEQLLAAVKRDPETAARLLIDMGEALRAVRGDSIDGYEKRLALLARLDALGEGKA